MEPIFLEINLITPSGLKVYEVKKRLTNQKVMHDMLMELKNNVKVRVALKEQESLNLFNNDEDK